MICGAPNDKLLPDGISVEVYNCELSRGHMGAHACPGYPMWHTEEPPEEDLATRALKAMLPPDAAEVADLLDGMAYKPKGWLVSDCEREALLRAVEILRGEP